MKRLIKDGNDLCHSAYIQQLMMLAKSVRCAATASIYCELAMERKLEKAVLQLVVLVISLLDQEAVGFYLVERDNYMFSTKKVAV